MSLGFPPQEAKATANAETKRSAENAERSKTREAIDRSTIAGCPRSDRLLLVLENTRIWFSLRSLRSSAPLRWILVSKSLNGTNPKPHPRKMHAHGAHAYIVAKDGDAIALHQPHHA